MKKEILSRENILKMGIPFDNLEFASDGLWGSDNICIKEKKKFGGKNLA